MITIKIADKSSSDCLKLNEWIVTEWGESENRLTREEEDRLPNPLLAFDEDRLIGGLTFSFYPDPITGNEALWINAVYILENYRGNKLGRKLIQMAEKEVSSQSGGQLGPMNIYAFTDKPKLYEKEGWLTMKESEGHYVMAKSIQIISQNKNHIFGDNLSMKTVYTAYSEIELNMLTSLLHDHGIMTQFKEKGIGEYLRIISGYNAMGSDIRVLEKDFNRAREILENFWHEANAFPDQEEVTTHNHKPIEDLGVDKDEAYRVTSYKKRRILWYIVIGVVVLSNVIPAIFALVYSLK